MLGYRTLLGHYRWIKRVEPATGGYAIEYGSIDEFIRARRLLANPDGSVMYDNFYSRAFENRLKEMNHRNAGGSRSGDIIAFTDGRAGFLCINDRDGLNGWHGGATDSESFVPMLFNMPGTAVVRGANLQNPAFIQQGLDNFVSSAAMSSDGYLRNWQVSPILESIYHALNAQ